MDSMRSLNSSLPRASPAKSDPPEQLLSAFKAAALSVTKLYKTAASDQARARSEGYQDALDELLCFLDKEDIGLSDGEGWRIRRWATERLDGREPHNESDEDAEPAERAPSPIMQRTQSATQLSTRSVSPVRVEPAIVEVATESPSMLPPTGTFTFRTPHIYPQDSDMNSSDVETTDNIRTPIESNAAPTNHHTLHHPSTVTTRSSRHASRQGIASRHNTRGSGTVGRAAGQKRKINLGEFFDIGNVGHHRDGFGGAGGGGKRSRYA